MTVGSQWQGPVPRDVLQCRASLLYAAVYLHYGVLGPFLPLWFSERGITTVQIGVLMSLPLFLRVFFVAPVTALADRYRRILDVLCACALGTAVLMAGLNSVHGYLALLAFFTVLSVLWDPLPVLTDAYAAAAVRTANLDFGRMRMWGSLSFIAANVAGGWLVDVGGPGIVTWLICALLLVPLAVRPLIPPDRLMADPAASSGGDWRMLLHDSTLLIIIGATALIVASHALVNAYSAIHWHANGYSGAFIGTLWGIGIGAEVVALWIGQRLLGDRSPLWMIVIGGTVAVVRWSLMALDPGRAELVGLQLLQGVTAMVTFPGFILFVARRVPVHLLSTSQGMNAVVLGVALALGTLACGPLWNAMGPRAYLVMALMSALGVAAIGYVLFGPQSRPRLASDPDPATLVQSAE